LLSSSSSNSSTLSCLLFTASGLCLLSLLYITGTARLCSWHCKHSIETSQQQGQQQQGRQQQQDTSIQVLLRLLQGLWPCLLANVMMYFMCILSYSRSSGLLAKRVSL
jgi:hypothetical protein